MATHWKEQECIWINVFDFLNSHDVGKCMLMSTLLRNVAKRHFRQVPTTVHVVQRRSWGKRTLVLPFDGNQGHKGVVYLSREKPFSHLYRMIASVLEINDNESHAVEIIYHGLLVGRPSKCNSPTFSKPSDGCNETPHVDVKNQFRIPQVEIRGSPNPH
jgi:hypothetical protein